MHLRDDVPEERASQLVERMFGLLVECRTIQTALADSRTRSEPQSARVERDLYTVLLGALEAGILRTMDDALKGPTHASQPLGPRGTEWLARQERLLDE